MLYLCSMKTVTGSLADEAAAVLRRGELVAVPTETVYGLAANALDTDAVLRIYETKGRPAFNPLIVHVKDAGEFEKYAREIHPLVYRLAEHFCPGPISFVLPKKEIIPDIVTGGGDTVALRVPAHPLTLELLGKLDFPLAAPSANPFGYISPVNAQHVADQLDGKISYILDGGDCRVGLESTVVTIENDQLIVLRLGGISPAELEAIAGPVRLQINQSSDPKSPGQLKSHYAPRIPLQLVKSTELVAGKAGKKIAVLSFTEKITGENIVMNEVLSSSGDLHEAARNLFAALRRLDASRAELILAERMPEDGLGLAINDRLERAAAG